MINYSSLQIGDIIGTTSASPLAALIKARTWGWRSMLDQKKCNHIATIVDRGHGLLYLAEMLSKGIELTELHTYDHKAPRQHICFVGRHDAFYDITTQVKYNNWILSQHSHGVKYGWDDFFRTEGWFAKRVKDHPDTMICNELPREGFKYCGIPYPSTWDNPDFCPMNWQTWVSLANKTGVAIC